MWVSITTNFGTQGLKPWPEWVHVRAGFSFTGGEAGAVSKGSIPAGTWPGKDVTCHSGRGWLQLAWKPSESPKGERNGRNLVGTATRGSPGKRHWVLFSKPSPGRGPAAMDVRAALFPAWKGRASLAALGARRGEETKRSAPRNRPSPAAAHSASAPQTPRLSPQPRGERGRAERSVAAGEEREGGDGAGRERKGRAGRREAGWRLALAAARGGGSR